MTQIMARVALAPIASLLGAPAGDIEDVEAGDICLVGLHFDHGDERRFGARFAARQLRYASRLDREARRGAPAHCRDLGDLNVFPLEPQRQEQALVRQISAILAAGGRPIVVGGAADLTPVFHAALTATPSVGRVRTMRLPGDVQSPGPLTSSDRLALIVDLSAFGSSPVQPARPLALLKDAIAALPARAIGAAHLAGLAPDIDVTGRREAGLGLAVLDHLVAHLAGLVT